MSSSRQLEELLLRWKQSQQRGESLSVEELCRDCPSLLPILRARIAGFAEAVQSPDTCGTQELQIAQQGLPEQQISLPADQLQLIDRVCNQFEDAWRQKTNPRLEDYLTKVPPSARTALLQDLLELELDYRGQFSDDARLEEYVSRFPGEASVVRSVFQKQAASERPEAIETADKPAPAGANDSTGAERSRQQPSSQPDLPSDIGRFTVQEEVGRGGMGVVLRVFDPDFERTLAVKLMLPKAAQRPEAARRFLEEAKLSGQLQHPGIPPVHEIGRLDNGLPYFAMKLIKGQTLASLLEENISLADTERPEQDERTRAAPGIAAPSPEALPRLIAIFGQVCQTIAYAHSRGVIHRDLKPLNIMVGQPICAGRHWIGSG